MRPLRAAILVLAAAALTGCYTSDKLLLDPARAAAPLAVGEQSATGPDGETTPISVSLEPDRWYRLRSGKDDDRVLFTPLSDSGAASPQRYAMAVEVRGRGYLYGVVYRQGRELQLDLPFCDQPAARAAAAAHGGVAPPGRGALSPLCNFTSAAEVAAALSDYADRPGPKTGLVRLAAAAD